MLSNCNSLLHTAMCILMFCYLKCIFTFSNAIEWTPDTIWHVDVRRLTNVDSFPNDDLVITDTYSAFYAGDDGTIHV